MQRCWCEIVARAEKFLDFIHRLSFGLGNDEKHEERAQHTEKCEQPERVVNVNGVDQRREEFRDEESKQPVRHAGD